MAAQHPRRSCGGSHGRVLLAKAETSSTPKADRDRMELRDYQLGMLDAVRAEMRAGKRRVVLGAATGSGKTACAAEIIRSANVKGNRCLFLADRRALIRQTLDRLDEWGIRAAPWFGGERESGEATNVVATFQTWAAEKPPGEFGLIVVDECHVRVGDGKEPRPQTAKAVLDHYGCSAVGLTATPFKKGMGEVWDALVYPEPTDSLIDKGHLVRPRVWMPSPVDVTGLRPGTRGEWADDELAQRLMLVVDDVVGRYVARVEEELGGRYPQTLVFAPSARSCAILAKEFSKRTGKTFQSISYLEGGTNESRIRRFRAGSITGLVSRDMIGRGFDVPDIRFVVMARPFRKALGEVIQQIGRGMRPAPGKESCLVHDHAGNFTRMGWMIDQFFKEGAHKFDPPKTGIGDPPTKECPECHAVVYRVLPTCPECGHEFPKPDPVKVERDFVQWVRDAPNQDSLRELAADVLKDLGLERFCAAVYYARMTRAANADAAARQSAATVYDLVRRKRKSAWFRTLRPARNKSVEALCERSYRLWLNAKRWRARHGAALNGTGE